MGELLRDATTIVNIGPKSDRAQFLFDIAPDLPPARGDRVEIEQVVVNLARNAVESMLGWPDQDRIVQIAVCRCGDGMVEVSVRDRGPGIAAEDMPQIFEPFYSTKADGMGMGLAICRSIVQRHDGRLWVTPNEDVGCTFHFTLPCQET